MILTKSKIQELTFCALEFYQDMVYPDLNNVNIVRLTERCIFYITTRLDIKKLSKRQIKWIVLYIYQYLVEKSRPKIHSKLYC